MSDCFVITLIKEFNRKLVQPYDEILVECQELIILIEDSANEIQSYETDFRIGNFVYAPGKMVGGALSLAAIGTAAVPATCGISLGLTIAGSVTSGVFGLAKNMHFLIKAVRKWKKHTSIKEIIEEKKIAAKLSALFNKIDRIGGISISRLSTYSEPKLNIASKFITTTISSVSTGLNGGDVVRGGIAMNAVKQGKDVAEAIVIHAPNAIKSSSSGWRTGATVVKECATGAITGYTLGGIGIAADIGSVAYDAYQLAKQTKCDRTKDLLDEVDTFLCALWEMTSRITDSLEELQIILDAHLSLTEDSACSAHHTDKTIYYFNETLKDIRTINTIWS